MQGGIKDIALPARQLTDNVDTVGQQLRLRCSILSAGEDSLRDDTEAIALRLVKAGICVTAQRIPEAMHGFTTNRTPGWEYALKKHIQFFREHLQEDNS